MRPIENSMSRRKTLITFTLVSKQVSGRPTDLFFLLCAQNYHRNPPSIVTFGTFDAMKAWFL